jgi:hypothetical protein
VCAQAAVAPVGIRQRPQSTVPVGAAGVMDAVAKGYLKNMYFGIATDATATNLLEVSSPSS